MNKQYELTERCFNSMILQMDQQGLFSDENSLMAMAKVIGIAVNAAFSVGVTNEKFYCCGTTVEVKSSGSVLETLTLCVGGTPILMISETYDGLRVTYLNVDCLTRDSVLRALTALVQSR